MIKKSIIVFLIIIICYNLLVIINPWNSKTTTQWEDNERRAETFIFNNKNYRTVIIGSSMSTRLIDSVIPTNWYKLAFGGQGVYEGFEIIRRANKYPDTLLVEMNIILRKPLEGYAANFFLPGIYHLKKKLPGMRKEYYPASFVQYFMYGLKGKINKILPSPQKNIVKKDTNKIVKQDKIKDELKKNKNKKNEIDTSMVFILKKEIKQFKKQAVTIIFFEMPIDKSLYLSEKQIKLREIINNNFPEIEFISLKSYDAYETSDGCHLTKSSALKYTEYLIKQTQ